VTHYNGPNMQLLAPEGSVSAGVPSFLRWAGSKRQLLDPLSSAWSSRFTRYVEPFAGSACLFFRIAPQSAVLSDINSALVSTLNAVKSDPERVHKHLHALPLDSRTYYEVRRSLSEPSTEFEAAGKFIYLNRLCFNGLYRTNNSGQFNVPYGGTDGGSIPSLSTLTQASLALRKADIQCRDFEITLRAAEPGDFVYIDPPFSIRSRRVFREYDSALFGLKALIRLKVCLKELAKKNISFVVSYATSPEAEFLTEGLFAKTVEVRRSIAGFSKHRKKTTEILAFSDDFRESKCLRVN
jgi:DNA adenine methylase